MQIEKLMYFLEIAKMGSTNMASEHLHISQQALSQAVRSMEEELDVILFKRSNKGMIVTEQGKALCEAAQVITERWLQFKEALEDQRRLAGTVELIISPFLEEDYLVPLIAYLKQYYPEIQLRIQSLFLEQALNLLQQERRQIVVGSFLELEKEELITYSDEICYIPLKQMKLAVKISRESPLARSSTLNIEQLANEVIVINKPENMEYYIMLELLRRKKHEQIIFVQSISTAHRMVENNLDIGFDLTNEQEKNDKVRLIPISTDFWIKIGVFLHQSKLSDPLLQPLLKRLEQLS